MNWEKYANMLTINNYTTTSTLSKSLQSPSAAAYSCSKINQSPAHGPTRQNVLENQIFLNNLQRIPRSLEVINMVYTGDLPANNVEIPLKYINNVIPVTKINSESINRMFGLTTPLMTINMYKFYVIKHILTVFHQPNSDENVAELIILLTMGVMGICAITSPLEHTVLEILLSLPIDWSFAMSIMKQFNLAIIFTSEFENVLYNPTFDDDKLLIFNYNFNFLTLSYTKGGTMGTDLHAVLNL